MEITLYKYTIKLNVERSGGGKTGVNSTTAPGNLHVAIINLLAFKKDMSGTDILSILCSKQPVPAYLSNNAIIKINNHIINPSKPKDKVSLIQNNMNKCV